MNPYFTVSDRDRQTVCYAIFASAMYLLATLLCFGVACMIPVVHPSIYLFNVLYAFMGCLFAYRFVHSVAILGYNCIFSHP
jgi:hypothetical protein